MPAPILHLGATVLCTHAGPGDAAGAFPRVLLSGAAGRHAAQPPMPSSAARSPARRPRPARRAMDRRRRPAWSPAARRRDHGRRLGLRADRHAADAGRRADARAGDVRRPRRCRRSISPTISPASAAPRRPTRRPHPRPDRAGAVHLARRARDAARISARACWRWCSSPTAPRLPPPPRSSCRARCSSTSRT